MVFTHTLIIGAGAAGLAAAACLQKQGIEYIILESCAHIANNWRNHYDRLHLHTTKKWSALPFKQYNASIPRYPARQQVVDYLVNYADELKIKPVFNTRVLSAKREDNGWIVETNTATYQSDFIVVATGLNHKPVIPVFKGMESFNGEIIHSSQYKNGAPFTSKDVLVVGFGNSAGEQAICLYEHGANPSLSVRSAVNVLPMEISGISILELSRLTNAFPAHIADMINAPLVRMLVGDITKLGLKKSKYGPREQIELEQKIPLLDIGTISLIKKGHIKVYGDIARIQGNRIYFTDYRNQQFDAIILATGYRHNLESFLHITTARIADLRLPVYKRQMFGTDGIYFCGFYISPMGMLREIGLEAMMIAKDIARKIAV